MKPKFHIQHFSSLPSTNDYAKEHYVELQNRDVIVCDTQTNGRGRFDRVWKSGNDVTFSIVFHEHAPFSLSIPLAIVQALQKFHIESMIKWPNDILVQGKKVCGILIESIYEGNNLLAQIVGIGVNISTPPASLQAKAISVAIDKSELITAILQAYEELEQMKIGSILLMYRKFHYLMGRKIMLNDVLWNVEDINEDGYLIVQSGSTKRLLKSEEVTLQQIY